MIDITGTGDYINWIGDGSIIVDEEVPTQQVNDIILRQYIEHTFMLYQGWNMITIPVENDYTAQTLGESIPSCSVITRFDPVSQTFFSYVVGSNYDNFDIEDGCGYYVYVTHTTPFIVNGFAIDAVSVDLYPGWNILGWFDTEPTNAESFGQNIAGCSVITIFNALTQTFDTHVVGTPHDNFPVEMGMGLFIYVNQASIWHGDG